ncbi:AAA family ATPase [Paenibacillus sp. strain BS8-2]
MMLELSGFRVVETLGSNEEISLYRVKHIRDGQRFIVKTTSEFYSGSDMKASFEEEFDRLRELRGKGTLFPERLEVLGERPCMFLQDPGGMTLEQLMQTQRTSLKLEQLMETAISAVECVRQLHREHMTLYELSPMFMLVNDSFTEVQLMDVRSSNVDGREHTASRSATRRLDSLLAYSAPEQTGRTGRMPDHRSDFYALGAILYEWFAGRPPFLAQNTMDLVYQHLATPPEPISYRNKSIPKMVSDIVLKCLEKMPEERYASAFGLKSDLEECMVQLRISGKVRTFPLANQDISERWIVSGGLIGRQAEQQVLLQALQRTCDGAQEVIWVSGKSGVGKTSLVRETLRSAMPAGGLFIRVKANSEGLPYDVWLQTVDQLTAHLLTLSSLQAEMWKLKIRDAVQNGGELLINHVPRLAALIGAQQTAATRELNPLEARTRLHLAMNRFIQLFLGQGQPLVLFLDDWHMADEAATQYLLDLLKDEATNHLLIVGAYRHQEARHQDKLQELSRQLVGLGTSTGQIQLGDYDRAALKVMLQPVMQGPVERSEELLDVLLRKTEGNPMLLQQFLQDIWLHELVSFNDRSRFWEWNIQAILERNVPEHAAAELADRLKQLPARTIHVLSRAAFLGKQFDLRTLSVITDMTQEQLLELGLHAEVRRLLQPIHIVNRVYAFQHDRIRKLAYQLVSEPEKTRLHLEIGELLFQRWKAGEAVTVFEVLSQWNQALSMLVQQGKWEELAELNLHAGVEAKQSADYEASLRYLRLATQLLEAEGWKACYGLTYQAYKERAEAEFRSANFAEAQELFHHMLNNAVTNMDKAAACLMLIQMETNRDRFHEVITLSEQALAYLGTPCRMRTDSLQLLRQWLRVHWKLRKKPVEALEAAPPMTDERYQMAMAVLDYASHANFVLDKKWWLSSTLMLLELTLDHGIAPESSIGFVNYAMVLDFKQHQYEAAYKWGKLACKVAQPNPRLHAIAVTALSVCYNSWRRYEPGLLPISIDDVSKAALRSGELWNANQSMLVNCGLLFQFSHPLKDIYRRLIDYAPHLQRNSNVLHSKQAAILARMILDLAGYSTVNDPYAGVDILAKSFAEAVPGDDTYFLQESIYIYQYITGYYFGDVEGAHAALQGCIQLNQLRADHAVDTSSHDFYYVLVLKERFASRDKREQRADWKEIRGCLKRLKIMAKRSPIQYLHKYLLAQAEAASIRKQDRLAETLYERAIDTARANGYIHDAGTAAECFAKQAISTRKERLAKLYINEAYESYRKWGAHAKTADMESKFGYLLSLKRESEIQLERIDYHSVVMSAQALSGEMEMDKLLGMLMRMMMQNAGAEYGALIFEDEEGRKVEAYGTPEKLHIASIPWEEAHELVPAAIVDYTARTKEEVVVDDAAVSGLFERNDYIKHKDLKSVLCLPIMNQNKLLCMLYLENNLSSGVFTEKRLDVLKLLSSQCAISIANAKLYSGIQFLKSNLEEQVEERSRALEKSMQATSEALAETTVYAERTRIAQEIHDIVGHTLTSTVLQIEAGRRLLHKDMDSAVVRLKEAQDLVRHSLSEIRNSVHMLKEDKYYDIEESLKLLIHDTERNMGVVIHTSIASASHLSFMHKKVIYHALQEGLTNGIRHGGSSEFYFRLEDDGLRMQFSLADNGSGASRIKMGFGLTMMRDRVEQLKGTLQIDSEPNKGSLLRIQMPYQLQEKESENAG